MSRRKLIAFGLIVFSVACSTRRVYDRPDATAPASAVNINTATVAELEKLPHIGRSTAEAIVEFRLKNGPFRRVEHLMMIRGMSEARLNDLRPMVRVE